MTSSIELFKNKTFPKWIKDNPIFSKIETFRKVFPTIGLSNFEDSISLKNEGDVKKIASSLLIIIEDFCYVRLLECKNTVKSKKTPKEVKDSLSRIVHTLSGLSAQLKIINNFILISPESGKTTLSLPNDIMALDGTVVFPRGTGLLKIYDRLHAELKKLNLEGLPNLQQSFQMKNFSSVNMPNKKLTIKFGSDECSGLWDIATMSMRGVQSCQTWDQGRGINSLKLIGSMVDPFTGIIYLTNGEEIKGNYGVRMMRRCVARYVLDKKENKPYVLLERMYPSYESSSLVAFREALQKRLPKDIKILYSGELGDKASFGGKLSDLFIPLSDELKKLDKKYYPYTDSGIAFAEAKNFEYTKNMTLVQNTFKKQIPKLFQKAIKSSAFTKTSIKSYGDSASKIMGELRAKVSKPKTMTAAELSDKFTNFIVSNAKNTDPFAFMKEHEKDLNKFFMSEFGNNVSPEFAEFATRNINSYIERSIKV